jgi:hypothetical protein
MSAGERNDARTLAAAFARQAGYCEAFAAPIYAELCRRCADDIAAGGAVGSLVAGFTGDPARLSLPLRLLGAVHDRVLAGEAPELAQHFPTSGGAARWPQLFDAFLAACHVHGDALLRALAHPPQTNSVGRCAALLPGFLLAAARSGKPLALLELGASAGLNLRFHRYRYEFGSARWGDAAADVVLRPDWRGPLPQLGAVSVADRHGCDLQPVDVHDAAARRRQLAFVWPDHRERFAQTAAALALAATDALTVDAADAVSWLPRMLATPSDGVATVIFHSSVWAYVPDRGQVALTAAIEAAGDRASAAAPLFWLRFEDEVPPPESGPRLHDLRLRSWPGNREEVFARGQPHGQWIEWRG